MNNSEKTGNIIGALIAIQEDMHVNKDGKNPHFKSKYATLDNILDTIKPILKENGLVVMQGTVTDERKIDCTTRVFHESGEWIESMATVYADKGTPQGYGSAITYARRYGIATTLGIGLLDDDDANKAEATTEKADKKKVEENALNKAKHKALTDFAKHEFDLVAMAFEELEGLSADDGAKDPLRDLIRAVSSVNKLDNIRKHIEKLVKDSASE